MEFYIKLGKNYFTKFAAIAKSTVMWYNNARKICCVINNLIKEEVHMFEVTNLNDYAYSMRMPRYFMFKDPKASSVNVDVNEYEKSVVCQVKEDIARLYCFDSFTINTDDVRKYLEQGYNIVGIKILCSEGMMHPMFYRVTKTGVKRKNINQKVQNYRYYPKNVGKDIYSIDIFVAYKRYD